MRRLRPIDYTVIKDASYDGDNSVIRVHHLLASTDSHCDIHSDYVATVI